MGLGFRVQGFETFSSFSSTCIYRKPYDSLTIFATVTHRAYQYVFSVGSSVNGLGFRLTKGPLRVNIGVPLEVLYDKTVPQKFPAEGPMSTKYRRKYCS